MRQSNPEKNSSPSYKCERHQVYMTSEDLHCKDPHLYCKHRTACIIWFICKEEGLYQESASQK